MDKGFRLEHIGKLLHAKYHQDFGAVFDKVQIKLYTEKEKVEEIAVKARKVYAERDQRVEGMTDETTDIFYSCTLCQSFAPTQSAWSVRNGPVCAALTTGWIVKPPMRSIPPAPTSR